MTNDIENAWVKKAMAGDMDAFEKLVYAYEKKVYSIAFNMFGNEQDAYDVSQEVFIKLYKNLIRFKFDSSFSTWLHRIATNTCIDEYRKKKRHKNESYSLDEPVDYEGNNIERQVKDHGKTPEEFTIYKEEIIEIRKAINNLKDDHKIIIILRDIRGHTYDEIALILNCSVGTVKSRLSRARNALKDIIIEQREHKT